MKTAVYLDHVEILRGIGRGTAIGCVLWSVIIIGWALWSGRIAL